MRCKKHNSEVQKFMSDLIIYRYRFVLIDYFFHIMSFFSFAFSPFFPILLLSYLTSIVVCFFPSFSLLTVASYADIMWCQRVLYWPTETNKHHVAAELRCLLENSGWDRHVCVKQHVYSYRRWLVICTEKILTIIWFTRKAKNTSDKWNKTSSPQHVMYVLYAGFRNKSASRCVGRICAAIHHAFTSCTTLKEGTIKLGKSSELWHRVVL